MKTTTPAIIGSRANTPARPIAESSANILEALDDATIAELAPLHMSQMTDAELAQVIRAARLSFLSNHIDDHLEYHNRNTLEQLAYLARRCCQNRTGGFH